MKAFPLPSRFLSQRVVAAIVALALPRAMTAGGVVFEPNEHHFSGLNIFAFGDTRNWSGATIGSLFSHTLTGDQVLVFLQDHATSEGLTFSLKGPHSFTLRGIGNHTLTLGGGIEVTSDNVASVTIGATNNLQHLELKMTGTGAFSVAAGKLLTVVSSISDIEGDYTLTKTGDGTLELSGESTYGGGTTISAGTIKTTVANALPTLREVKVEVEATLTLGEDQTLAGLIGGGAVQIGAGKTLTLDVAQHAEWDFSGVISGVGSKLVKDGLGTQILSGEQISTYSGGTWINAGTLKATAANVLPTSGAVTIADGGVLSVGADQTIGSLSGSSGSRVKFEEEVASFSPPDFKLTVNGSMSTTFAGTISGDGSLVKDGSGKLTLTGTNTYNGSTTISGGTLQLGNGGSNGSIATDVDVADGATLAFHPNADTDFHNLISGEGGVSTSGSVTLTLGANNTYSGGTTINGGTLTVVNTSGSGTGTGAVTINGGTVLQIGDGTTTDAGSVAGTIANHGTLYFNRPGTLTHASVISEGGAVSVEKGTVTLTGANTYNGGTTIKDGAILALGRTGGATLATGADIMLEGAGELQVNQNQTIRGLKSSSTTSRAVLASGKALTINLPDATDTAHTAATFAGVISGAGGLVMGGPGTFTVTGDNTYAGGTTINQGTLVISQDANLGAVPANATPGILTLNGGVLKTTASFTLDAKRGVALGGGGGEFKVESGKTLTSGGVITGQALTKSGLGSLTLTGANTYQGITKIEAGHLFANNSSGSATGMGMVEVLTGAVLAGNGSIGGELKVGGTVAPGLAVGAPGKLKAGPTTFESGGKFDFQITDASEGAGTHYSLLEISGVLTIDASSESQFIVNLLSFNGSIAGTIANFDANQAYSWKFASATGLAGTLDGNAFHVNTANFSNSLAGGSFAVGFVDNDLFVSFTPVPEPSTWALLALGLGAVWCSVRRGRRATREK